MCLAVIAWHPDSEIPLTIIANRDEFRQRPTQPMHWWPENILAGKDLEAGGTWLGANRKKRFALLTNIRPGYVGVTRPKSRGHLVTDFLTSDLTIPSYQQKIADNIDQYAGFNLLLSDGNDLFWFSSDTPRGKFLSSGIYGLSNDALDTQWPKLTLAKQQLRSQLLSVQKNLTEHTVLQSTQIAQINQLPKTGISIEREQMISAQTIIGTEYGTRCRTHITQNSQGKFSIAEQQIDHHGKITATEQWLF